MGPVGIISEKSSDEPLAHLHQLRTQSVHYYILLPLLEISVQGRQLCHDPDAPGNCRMHRNFVVNIIYMEKKPCLPVLSIVNKAIWGNSRFLLTAGRNGENRGHP
jgi:hypothetical protein